MHVGSGILSAVANSEHLELLKRGAEEWNSARITSPDFVDTNLQGCDLSGYVLANADFRSANLTGVNLDDADCRGSRFQEAFLREATGIRTRFDSADLSNLRFEGSNFFLTSFRGCKLSGAHANGTTFHHCDFESADCHSLSLVLATVTDSDFGHTTLVGAHLFKATFRESGFVGADLTDARMGETVFMRCELAHTRGLEAIRHSGPSTLDITALLTEDWPVPFLRGIGAPDVFLTYRQSLRGLPPIQFHSCFLSHSSEDQQFCDRLYTNLQASGVHCWFAPEDLKIGEKFRQRIDESIRVQDKLLLVLSEKSIASDWVENEVEAAFDKEQQTGRLVLFPIRLDDAVIDSSVAWARTIRRTRHIGDFTRWKDHDAYQKAFSRLLGDLKAADTPATSET